MRIAICGMGNSGKHEASRYLSGITGLRYVQSTSEFAASFVRPAVEATGVRYTCDGDCWRDRRKRRQIWRDAIARYNAGDPARMYREMIEENDIIDGLRMRCDIEACRKEGIVQTAIWIERPGICFDPTCEILASDCDHEIRNDGSLELFYSRLDRLSESLGLSKIPADSNMCW